MVADADIWEFVLSPFVVISVLDFALRIIAGVLSLTVNREIPFGVKGQTSTCNKWMVLYT